MSKNYLNSIVKHYEDCLNEYGDSHLGVDWPKLEDVEKRYKIMLSVIKTSEDSNRNTRLLDFGCGAAHLLQFIYNSNIKTIEYSGLDVSDKFVSLCKSKYPEIDFYRADILDDHIVLPTFDYVIMNGVFTEKRELSFDQMWEYFTKMLIKIFAIAKKGIAFNVMSKAVEWEREDLFHVPADPLIKFITSNLSRNFVIRNDYGLYEYTTYVYK